MEIKILIEAPELAASLNNLAAAVSNFGEIKVQPVIAAPVADQNKPQQPDAEKSAPVPDWNTNTASEVIPAKQPAPAVQAPVTVTTPASNPAPVVPAAPVVQAPVEPQPVAPAPVANPTVQQSMTAAPVTSVSQTIPPVTTDSPAVEQPASRKYTMQDIAKVGSALLDKGMMPQLSAILSEMGVQAIPQLREDQYPIVAEKLIALGGKFE